MNAFVIPSSNSPKSRRKREKLEHMSNFEIDHLKLVLTNEKHVEDENVQYLQNIENHAMFRIEKCGKIQKQFAKSCIMLHEGWKKEYDLRFSTHLQYYNAFIKYYVQNVLDALRSITNADIQKDCLQIPNNSEVKSILANLKTFFSLNFNDADSIKLTDVYSMIENDYTFTELDIDDSIYQFVTDESTRNVLIRGSTTGLVLAYTNRMMETEPVPLFLPNQQINVDNPLDNEHLVNDIIDHYCTRINNAFHLLIQKEIHNRAVLYGNISDIRDIIQTCRQRIQTYKTRFNFLDAPNCTYLVAYLLTMDTNLKKINIFLQLILDGFSHYDEDLIREERNKIVVLCAQ